MMYYKPKYGYILTETNYNINRFRNTETLNIFCDGSYYSNRGNHGVGGFAAVAVVCENVINICRRGWSQQDVFANDLMELYALREAISMAYQYKNMYSNINIFSDSKYAINVVKNWIYKWKFNPDTETYTKGSNKVPANINIVYEIALSLINLMVAIPNLNLLYVKGHINSMANIHKIRDAKYTFCHENSILDSEVDLNLIRYLSRYNDIADREAKIATDNHEYNCNMYNAIQFIPEDINMIAKNTINSNILYS